MSSDTAPVRDVPAPPDGISARAVGLWCELWQSFDLNPAETILLERLCRALTRAEAIEADLEGTPLVVAGSKGQDAINPRLPELRQVEDLIRRLTAALKIPDSPPASSQPGGAIEWDGMTASERARTAANLRWGRA